MFINDIFTTCKNPLYLFADDSTLYRLVPNDESLDVAVIDLQSDLSNFAEWTEDWNARFNPSKCEGLLISRKNYTSPLKTLTLYNQPIPVVESLKILGMKINSTLCYGEQIQNLEVRASRALGSLCRTSPSFNLQARTILYKSLVR